MSYIAKSTALPLPFLLGGDAALKVFELLGVDSGVKLLKGFTAEVIGDAITSGLRISWLPEGETVGVDGWSCNELRI